MTYCEVRLPGCHGRAVHSHHRKLRAQGGDDSLFNLLSVCASCHDGVHREPARAYLHGWMVKSWDDASRNPVIPWEEAA